MLADLQKGEIYTNLDFIFYDRLIVIDWNFCQRRHVLHDDVVIDSQDDDTYDDLPGLEPSLPCPSHCRICYPRSAKL
ncbi:hypothetical protein FB451DRAFT_1395547 [Mycena latifolia]|nr:hypothetical protein FB451DRAFT_1395547 [Mycena latifolia]